MKRIFLVGLLLFLTFGAFALEIKAAVFKGPSGFGMIKLFSDPPFLGENIDLSLTVLPTPREMVAKTATKELDIAIFPVNIAAKMYSKGPGYKLGAVTGLGIFSLLSRENITTWSDLKGKEIYSVGKGATPEYLFNYLADKNGIDLSRDANVLYNFASASQLSQLIIGGKVNNAVLPEPFVTLVLLKSPDVKKAIDFQNEWKKLKKSEQTFPVTVVVMKPDLVKTNPKAVKRFLDAYRDSIEWVNNNPLEASFLIEKYGILSASVAKVSIKNCNLTFIPAKKAKPLIEDFLTVMLKANPDSVGGKLPDENFYLENY